MPPDPLSALARSAVHSLDAWVQERGLKGFDPYDVRGTALYLWSLDPARARSIPAKLARGAFSVLENTFPRGLRKLFGVCPAPNAKAMALFAKAYMNLHAKGLGGGMLGKGLDCLAWLEANPSLGYAGPCWGYPFHWQSSVLLPRNTPSSVVTWTAGDAFWQAYRMTGNSRYLDVCIGICEFFSRDLNRSEPRPGQLCFSYTPLDRMHVINATLFAGEFLMRVGLETGNETYARDARAVAEYVVAHQAPDGSWPYFGKEDRKPATVDHYHTGFVLRMMHSLAGLTEEPRYVKALDLGFAFYWDHLFESGGLPRAFYGQDHPLNIHAVSEALICLGQFDGRGFATRDRQQFILKWTLETLRDPEGWFYFSWDGRKTVKFPFMRWGQAWMLLALSEVLTGGEDRS